MNDKEPMVSVIMANHNKGRFLSEAIDSVLLQSFQNFEIIIIDDASTDHSREIIKKYAEKYTGIIKPIFLERRSGPSIARNCGIQESRGDYIAILDSDDKWEENNLRIKVDFLENNTDFALVGSCGWRITESSKVFEEWNVPCNLQEILESLTVKNVFIHSSILFLKKVFLEVGMYKENELGIEDWMMIRRISDKYPVVNLSKKLCYWRLAFNSVSLSVDRDWVYNFAVKQKRDIVAGNFLGWAYRFYNVTAYTESFQALTRALRLKWYGFQLWAFFFSKFLFRPKIVIAILQERFRRA